MLFEKQPCILSMCSDSIRSPEINYCGGHGQGAEKPVLRNVVLHLNILFWSTVILLWVCIWTVVLQSMTPGQDCLNEMVK